MPTSARNLSASAPLRRKTCAGTGITKPLHDLVDKRTFPAVWKRRATRSGCRNPVRATPGGGRRFRLSGKLIKGQRFGGVPDEWVVIEEVDRAAALAERILGAPDGAPLFSNVGISQRIKGLRAWLRNSGPGAH